MLSTFTILFIVPFLAHLYHINSIQHYSVLKFFEGFANAALAE